MIIDRHNYEEYFLLYVDRELTDDQRRQVEDFASRHPDLQQELEILKQTVAIPSAMVFDDKASLMREEKEPRKILVYWWRVAAALILLLAGAWFFRILSGPEKALPVPDNGRLGTVPKLKAKPPDQKPAATGVAYTKTVGADRGSVPAAVKKNPDLPLAVGKKAVNKRERVLTPAEQFVSAHPSPAKMKISAPVLPEKVAAPSISAEAIQWPGVVHAVLPVAADSSQARQGLAANRSGGDVRRLSKTDSTNTGESILVFDDKTKAVAGFLKRLTAADPPKDASASSSRRKISVSVFQFNIKK